MSLVCSLTTTFCVFLILSCLFYVGNDGGLMVAFSTKDFGKMFIVHIQLFFLVLRLNNMMMIWKICFAYSFLSKYIARG